MTELADANLLGHHVLPLRVPRDFDCAVRLSASGVYAYLRRRALERHDTEALLARQRSSTRPAPSSRCSRSSVAGRAQLLALEPRADAGDLRPGGRSVLHRGLVLTLAISRLAARINVVHAADLTGAAFGCLVLIPLLNLLGAPGVVLVATTLAALAAVLFSPPVPPPNDWAAGGCSRAGAARRPTLRPRHLQRDRDERTTKERSILFSKWNSFSRIGVCDARTATGR